MSIIVHDCPFCGYTDVVIDEPTPLSYSVGCPECDSVGPSCTTVNGAINLWNNRTPNDWHDDEGPIR